MKFLYKDPNGKHINYITPKDSDFVDIPGTKNKIMIYPFMTDRKKEYHSSENRGFKNEPFKLNYREAQLACLSLSVQMDKKLRLPHPSEVALLYKHSEIVKDSLAVHYEWLNAFVYLDMLHINPGMFDEDGNIPTSLPYRTVPIKPGNFSISDSVFGYPLKFNNGLDRKEGDTGLWNGCCYNCINNARPVKERKNLSHGLCVSKNHPISMSRSKDIFCFESTAYPNSDGNRFNVLRFVMEGE